MGKFGMIFIAFAIISVALLTVLQELRVNADAPEQSRERTSGLGEDFTVFSAPVRSAVELERIPGPRDASFDKGTFGPEFQNTAGPFRPGQQYHLWLKAVNYTTVPQSRSLEVSIRYAGVVSNRDTGFLTGKDDILVIVYSYSDDTDTIASLGGPGLGGANGPLILEGEESKTFLVYLKFGNEMPPGNWDIFLHLR